MWMPRKDSPLYLIIYCVPAEGVNSNVYYSFEL